MAILIPVIGPPIAAFFTTIAALLAPLPITGPFLAAWFVLLAAL